MKPIDERTSVTRQTWVAAVAALIFLACVAIISFAPVPYVAWTPGSTYNLLSATDGKPLVEVTGVESHPTTGELQLTTVGVTPVASRLNLLEALVAYWRPSSDALPRDAVYPPQLDPQTVTSQEAAQMGVAQSTAAVAAVREAGLEVRELPQVVAVTPSGPAVGHLEVGDLIAKIGDTAVSSADGIEQAMAQYHVGDQIPVTYLRDDAENQVKITAEASATLGGVPDIGVTFAPGYTFAPRVHFNVDPAIGGPSGGLMFSLAIYDKLSGDDVAGGRIVAGSGTIDAQGRVGTIGGIKEKIAGAMNSGATIFLLPAGNCADVARTAGIQLVPVGTLRDAVRALQATKSGAGSVDACP